MCMYVYVYVYVCMRSPLYDYICVLNINFIIIMNMSSEYMCSEYQRMSSQYQSDHHQQHQSLVNTKIIIISNTKEIIITNTSVSLQIHTTLYIYIEEIEIMQMCMSSEYQRHEQMCMSSEYQRHHHRQDLCPLLHTPKIMRKAVVKS